MVVADQEWVQLECKLLIFASQFVLSLHQVVWDVHLAAPHSHVVYASAGDRMLTQSFVCNVQCKLWLKDADIIPLSVLHSGMSPVGSA